MKEILCYDHSDEFMLFDEDLVAKPETNDRAGKTLREKRLYIYARQWLKSCNYG